MRDHFSSVLEMSIFRLTPNRICYSCKPRLSCIDRLTWVPTAFVIWTKNQKMGDSEVIMKNMIDFGFGILHCIFISSTVSFNLTNWILVEHLHLQQWDASEKRMRNGILCLAFMLRIVSHHWPQSHLQARFNYQHKSRKRGNQRWSILYAVVWLALNIEPTAHFYHV